jgi:secreted PhoX family phosphatase
MIHVRRTHSNLALALLGAGLLQAAAASADTGPSSSQTPYLVPDADGVGFVSVVTAGDAVKKSHAGNQLYHMVGIPDGLGAYDNGDGTITVLMNHELTSTSGVPRDHGGKGAFVSTWQVRKSDLKVLRAGDLIQEVQLWDGTGYVNSPGTAFNRFCSADLPAPTAFFNPATGLGFNDGRIYMNGEETAGGRTFAHLAEGEKHGTSYELPALGRMAFENSVANPFPQDKTIVAELDDTTPGEVYFHVGTKQATGLPIERAGLQGGTLYTTTIEGFTSEPPLGFTSAPFSLKVVENPANAGADPDGTPLNRPEDGSWDPTDPSRFYFVTTASFTTNTRLWRITFDDITHPEDGGTIEVLVDGSLHDVKMMDNITVDGDGNVTILEDVGNNARLGRVWRYLPASNTLVQLAEHDAARFLAGGAQFLTQDEESSGVIEVTGLFEGVPGYDTQAFRYFLLDVQAHYGIPGEVVEGGQLLMMKTPQ